MARDDTQARPTPAESLQGKQLENGWTVVERVPKPEDARSFGYSSCTYLVQHEKGRPGFMKALDLHKLAADADDLTLKLELLLKAFNHERNLLHQCGEKRLNRVVLALNSGVYTVPGFDFGAVPYLIFERADGDARAQADLLKRFDQAWVLRSLHQLAVGLNQLHGIDIAHLDMKPSNTLVYQRIGVKVADLGRADQKNNPAPHSDMTVAGDRRYAPPEQLYRAVSADWNPRRFGCDAYLLGSMIMSFFLGAGMTPLVLTKLDPSLRPSKWTGSYAEVLPYLRHATEQALADLGNELDPRLKSPVRDEIVSITRQLTEPDPALRGHPKERTGAGNQYSLERYISRLNVLATEAEHWLKAPART